MCPCPITLNEVSRKILGCTCLLLSLRKLQTILEPDAIEGAIVEISLFACFFDVIQVLVSEVEHANGLIDEEYLEQDTRYFGVNLEDGAHDLNTSVCW